MDLGTKRPAGPEAVSPAKTDKNKLSYPSFTVRDKKAKDFIAEYDCEYDDEYTATIKFRISGLSNNEWGNSVECEIQSIDNVKEVDGTDDKPESDEEEKTLGYKRKKNNPDYEEPDTSAESLKD